MATKKEFQTYMTENKANLNQEALKGADMNMVYNEWKDTGSISKNYLKQPIPTPAPTTPNTGVVTPAVPKSPVTPTQPVVNQPTQTTGTQTQQPTQQPAPVVPTTPTETKTIETPTGTKVETKTTNQPQIDQAKMETFNQEYQNMKAQGLTDMQIRDKTASKYGLESEQLKLINSYQQGQLQTQIDKNPDNIFNQLASGGIIYNNEVLKSPEYQQTKARFETYSKYKDFTDKQFQTAFNEGLILPGTQLYNDLSKNPKIKLQMDKANALNRVNGEKTDSKKVFETQSEEIGNNTKVELGGQTMTLTKALEDGYISNEEYSQFTNTSEVIAKSEEVEKLKNRADELQNIYDNVRLEVEEQLKGTGATKSDLESIVGERQKNMLGNLNLAISKYNNALGTLTELKKTNSEMFATNLGLYKDQLNYQRSLESEQRQRDWQLQQMGIQRGFQLEDREYQEDLAQRQLEQKYAYEYGDLNSENPTLQNIAIERAVASMYENYPIPGMESQSVKVQKVKNLMSQGMTGTQAIAQVENEIRNSQRYKDYLSYEKARITPQTETKYGFQNVGDGTIAVTDPTTGQVRFEKLTDSQDKVINLGDGEVGGQCGTYARQYTGISGSINSLVGPTITERKKSFTDKQPQVGGLALFTGPNYDKTYGHIGVITGINADGTLTITESNLRGDERITTRVVNPKEVTGFYNNTPMASQMTGGTTTGTKEVLFSRQNEPQYKNYLTTGKIGTNTEEIKQIEKEFGSITEFKKQAEAYNNSPGGPRDQEIKQITKIKDTLQELTKETGAISNVAGTIATALTPGGLLEKKDFLGKLQNVLDQKTLQSLIDAKGEGATFGALSNEELRMLQAVGSVLSARAIRDKETNAIKYFDMSEKALKNELQKMIDTYNQNINKINVKMGNTGTSTQYKADNGKVYKITIK